MTAPLRQPPIRIWGRIRAVQERLSSYFLVNSEIRVTLRMGEGRFTDRAEMKDAIRMQAEEVLRVELEELRREHRDLDEAIEALEMGQRTDLLQLRRLKKQKLALKDRIGRIEDQLTPDIIA